MDRRKFLNRMCAATVGLRIAAGAAKVGAASNAAVLGHSAVAPMSRAGICRVIGVGNRGCAAVLSLARTPAVAWHLAIQAEFICIDSGHDSLDYIDASNAAPGGHQPRIRTLSLCSSCVGSSVELARTIAWQKRTELRALMHGADLVFLVAGMGGGVESGVESGVPPLLAAWAREAGAFVVVAATMPFEWEGEQSMARARTAVGQLQHAADGVVQFSNDELAQALGEDASIDEFFTAQDHQISTCLRRVAASKVMQHERN